MPKCCEEGVALQFDEFNQLILVLPKLQFTD
jgi:hypothetical protein